MAVFNGDETASFFGFLGTAAALVFSCMGIALVDFGLSTGVAIGIVGDASVRRRRRRWWWCVGHSGEGDIAGATAS
ncbi:V-type proton ATPase 16 kDa proteolipid subunit [Bienertia sinuspersici]